MTTDLIRKTRPASSQSLTGLVAALRTVGLTLPPKHHKAIEAARNIRTDVAEFVPTPDDVLDAMTAAMKAGENPLDTDEARRYAVGQGIIVPDIAAAVNRRVTEAVDAAIKNAIPDVIESLRPMVEEAGEHIATAFTELGESWVTATPSVYRGSKLARFAKAAEAVDTLRKVAGVWSSVLALPGHRHDRTAMWLVFAEADIDHIAYSTNRTDPMLLVLKGLPVEMASMDTLTERLAKVDEYRATLQRRQEAVDLAARTSNMTSAMRIR